MNHQPHAGNPLYFKSVNAVVGLASGRRIFLRVVAKTQQKFQTKPLARPWRLTYL
jgi:hypothetical protein